MTYENNFATQFYFLVYIILAFYLLYNNLRPLLDFKWFIDYYKAKDNICTNNIKTEIENYRYNIYDYALNKNIDRYNFEKIENSYKNSYNNLLLFFIISFCIFLYFGQNIFAVFFLISLIIYVIVNSYIIKSFQNINENIRNINNDFCKYWKSYKILNAFILVNEINNDTVKYTNTKLNTRELTFDELLENNIFSYENINNTSKVKMIKNQAYTNLDFVKYFVLDKTSSYFLDIFQNLYIKYYDKSIQSYQKIYLILSKKQANYDIIKNMFDELRRNILDKIQTTFSGIAIINDIKEKINNLPISLYHYAVINSYWDEIYKIINNSNINKTSNEYKKITIKLLEIKTYIAEMNKNDIYINKNNLIHKLLQYNDIPNSDYIKFLEDNSDILFDYTYKFDTMNECIKYQANIVYFYFIYIFIFLLMLLHVLFNTINSIIYPYVIIFFIIIYSLILNAYSKMNKL